MQPVPRSEVFHLFSVKIKKPEISEGMWARIKGGHYKGDLAQVLHNDVEFSFAIQLVKCFFPLFIYYYYCYKLLGCGSK